MMYSPRGRCTQLLTLAMFYLKYYGRDEWPVWFEKNPPEDEPKSYEAKTRRIWACPRRIFAISNEAAIHETKLLKRDKTMRVLSECLLRLTSCTLIKYCGTCVPSQLQCLDYYHRPDFFKNRTHFSKKRDLNGPFFKRGTFYKKNWPKRDLFYKKKRELLQEKGT